MDFAEVLKYAQVILRELSQRKFKVLVAISLVSFTVMLLGMLRPSSFQSSITIYADNQNIIKPLLGSKASVTNVKQKRSGQVKDIINSPRLLKSVIKKVYGEQSLLSVEEQEQKMAYIRKNITINHTTFPRVLCSEIGK